MSKIIAVACHKGGTGKTTTAYWLARHFARMAFEGDRDYMPPMLIDLDPLATLTRTAGLGEGGRTIADVLLGEQTPFDAKRMARLGPALVNAIAADSKLAWAAAYMQAQSPNHKFLFNALRSLPANVPVIIDCPPSAGILIVNALVAATHVVIPVEPEREAIDGMLHMLEMVDDCQGLGNGAKIVGAIVTRANPNVLRHQQGIERIETELRERNIPLIGLVPLRQGQDAESKLGAAYAGLAEKVWRQIAQTPDEFIRGTWGGFDTMLGGEAEPCSEI